MPCARRVVNMAVDACQLRVSNASKRFGVTLQHESFGADPNLASSEAASSAFASAVKDGHSTGSLDEHAA